MHRVSVRWLTAGFLVGVLTPASWSQIAIPVLVWKYRQPWTKPWHSHESVVRHCSGAPAPFATVAVDDWICTQTGPIHRFTWWGTSPQPNQTPNQPFYIAIYSDANCQPGQLLYQTCVIASRQMVSIDCQGRRVFWFNAVIPAGAPVFHQQQGQHYWLQISEVDFGMQSGGAVVPSPTINAVDFEWSPHRPIKNCPALQMTPAGTWQPLLDACDNNPEDLAFIVYRNYIQGTIAVPTTFTANPAIPRPVFIAEWRSRSNPTMVHHVECFTLNDDGSFYLEPEVPPGEYRLAIRGMSFRPSFFDVFVEDPIRGGGGTDLGSLPVSLGDVNGDGRVDFADITNVLVGWAP